ncbi:hypothetical protein ACWEOO_03450 [Kribbella sp. NPDC004138]
MTDFDDPRTAEQVVEEPTRSAAEVDESPGKPEGPAVAAVLAVGIGALTLGVVTTVAEMSTSVSDWLNWYNRVGPLSGKTILTVAVWLLSWAVLHATLRRRAVMSRAVVLTAVILIALGLLGTFPPFFDLFASD